MIIQVVNFNLEGITHEQYQGAATELAPSFNEVKGLKSKVWLSDKDNNVYGGVYTRENRESMEDYVKSQFYDEVLDGPTQITNH